MRTVCAAAAKIDGSDSFTVCKPLASCSAAAFLGGDAPARPPLASRAGARSAAGGAASTAAGGAALRRHAGVKRDPKEGVGYELGCVVTEEMLVQRVLLSRRFRIDG